MSKKLLILEPEHYPESAIEILKKSGFDALIWDRDAKENSYDDVSVIMIRLKHYIDSNFVSKFPQLELIISPTTGLTHISKDIQDRLNIINIEPDDPFIKEITPTAEHAILLALMAQRNIKQVFSNIDCDFNRPASTFGTLKNAKILIYGHGRIGSHIARLIKPFTQIEPDIYDIIPERSNLSYSNLKGKLGNYNLIFICTKYTGEIQIDEKFVKEIGNKTVLINIARGEIVDEIAILEKLKSNLDFFYCTDVLKDEHIYWNNVLYNHSDTLNNLIITPHIGGYCFNSLQFIEYNIVKKFINKKIKSK